MNGLQGLKTLIGFAFLAMASCKSHQTKIVSSGDTIRTKVSEFDPQKQITDKTSVQSENKNLDFERKIYLEIDAIYSGKAYTDINKHDVFYRVLEIPEEENIMLIAEKISIGEEGGNYKLIKRVRLTDDGAALPKFGLNRIDSVKFLDSVRIEGYFNGEKKIINIDAIGR